MLFIVALGLLVLSWWQPMHLRPWVSWHSEMLAFIAMAMAAIDALKRSRQRGDLQIALPTLIIPCAMLIPLTALQWLNGQIDFSGSALVVGFYTAMALLALAVGFNISRGMPLETQQTPARLHIVLLAGAVLIGAIGSVLIALSQTLLIWEDLGWIHRTAAYRRPGGNLGQPNQLATLILMGCASLIYLHESRRIGPKVSLALTCILTMGLAITESRSGALGFFIITAWWAHHRKRIGFHVAHRTALSIGAAFIGMLWAWPKFTTFIHSGGAEAFINSTGISLSSAGRFVVWPQLLEAALQRPWFGWGLGEVGVANNAVLSNYTEGLPLTYAHNIVLDLLIGTGIPLTLLFVTLTLLWLAARLKRITSLTSWFGVALFLPVAVHSMFEFPFAYAYFLLPAALAIGVVEGSAEPLFGTTVHLDRRYCTMVLAALCAGTVWGAVEYFALEEDYRQVRFEAAKVGHRPKDYERPNIHLLNQLSALNDVSRGIPLPEMSEDQIEIFRKVAMRYPWFATQNRYAMALALNGSTDEAIRQLKVMRAMHGEQAFVGIRTYWQEMAQSSYPQLRDLPLP